MGQLFKFTSGFNARVLVEIKLFTNSKLLSGCGKQLEKYKDAEDTSEDFYVVIDEEIIGKKYKILISEHKNRVEKELAVSKIKFTDGNWSLSASKLKQFVPPK